MKSEELFAGFTVAAGQDRFGEGIRLGEEPAECKLSGRDTGGAMCVFELRGGGGGPRHLHHEQDEWLYVVEGEFEVHVGEKQFSVGPGGSVFLPRQTPHAWACMSGGPGKVIDVYQPAGKIEEFFRELGKYSGRPYVHEVLSFDEFCRLFEEHGMKVAGPPIVGEWKVEEDGRITQLA